MQLSPNNPKISIYLYAAYRQMGKAKSGIHLLSLFDAEEPVQNQALSLGGDYYSQQVRQASIEERAELLESWKKLLDGFAGLKEKMEWNLQMSMYAESIGDLQAAIRQMEQAKSNVDFGDTHGYYLASLYEANKQFTQADDLLKAVLASNPKFAHGWNFLGYSQLEREDGNLELAKTYIMKAVELDPQSPHFRDSLGWYYYKKGSYSEALKEIQFAYTLNSQDSLIGRHLVHVFMALELKDQAREMLNRLSQYFPAEDWREFQHNLVLDRSPASE